MSEATHGALRELLCQLGLACRDAVLAGRRGVDVAALARVDGEGGGDTIYAVDRIGEAGILEWFRAHWPKCFPVQIVMEGLVGDTCFPQGIAPEETDWKCIIDPIDGTRGIMYDKRSAWALAGIAPQAGEGTMLSHIVAAAMTEIPTTRQWRADQFSATRGGAVVGVSEDVRAGGIWPLEASPSQATGSDHGVRGGGAGAGDAGAGPPQPG